MDELAHKLLFNLKIIGFKDSKLLSSVTNPFSEFPLLFVTPFNPETLKTSHQANFDYCQPAAAPPQPLKFKGTEPPTFSLEFTLDGTGVSGIPAIPGFVTEQVALFHKVTIEVDGSIHRPNYLIVTWGAFIRTCNLVSSEITYTLFDSNGIPLRAKINATFKESTDGEFNAIASMFSSPDLTHTKSVQAGDLLPLMVYREYRKQDYYLQVARANNLKNFRKLIPGKNINLPPLA